MIFFTKGSHLYDLYETSIRGRWGEFRFTFLCTLSSGSGSFDMVDTRCYADKESSMSGVKFSFTSFPDDIQSSIKVKEKQLEKGSHF